LEIRTIHISVQTALALGDALVTSAFGGGAGETGFAAGWCGHLSGFISTPDSDLDSTEGSWKKLEDVGMDFPDFR
jgi:hypothetical protein